MLTLAIEISNPSATEKASRQPGAGVALGRIGNAAAVEPLGVEPVETGSRDADDLLPAIDRLARRVGVTPQQIERVAVSVGPGGFTGVRMAVAAAKMIAWASGARCVAVPSALVAAEGVRQRLVDHAAPRPATLIVALASKHDSAWLHALRLAPDTKNAAQAKMLCAELGDADRLAELFGSRTGGTPVPRSTDIVLIADRFLPAPMRGAAESAHVRIEPSAFDAAHVLTLAAALPAITPDELLPLYPREPDAVRLWRQRHGAS